MPRSVLLLLLPAVLLMFSCKISVPFRGPGYDSKAGILDPEIQNVVVGLTHAVTGDDGKLNSLFFDHTYRLHASLDEQPGIIGHAIRRNLFGKEAWTMTVWKDEASMRAFVEGPAHRQAIKESYDALVRARFAVIVVKRDEIPLSWTRAEELLEERGWEYGIRKDSARESY